ncbi:MAG: 50S ribosomal protein L33 [Coprobacillaceae bacterium]
MQENIIMVCTDCKMENYISKKDKRKHPDRLELKKYCPKCNKATVHREKKK